jgi:ATP-dependent RNA helicase DeaD
MPEIEAAQPAATFTALGLDSRILETLDYSTPTPIQHHAIPAVLSGADVIGLAGTGTGKTAAFTLPLVHQLLNTPRNPQAGVAVLVLTPTRELATQVAKAVTTYGKPLPVKVLAVYGGTGYGDQIRAIRRGVDVIIATPGRALDLVKQGLLNLGDVRTVVLDEADEMLDMGFAEDIDALLAQTPSTRQTLLFSATMPPRIEGMTKRHQTNPVRIQLNRGADAQAAKAHIRQCAFVVQREYKGLALARILDVERPTSAIIFCATRNEADELKERLSQREIQALALHGGLTQDQRDRVMRAFRSGQVQVLVATDIAARGLDIAHLSHVFNYDVPQQPEVYMHRIGRVGRAGRSGVAMTLITPQEQYRFRAIEREVKSQIHYANVPTSADLEKARQARLTAKVTEALAEPESWPELEQLLGQLEQTHDLRSIALTALALLTEPGRDDDERDIPNPRQATMQGGQVPRSRLIGGRGNVGSAGDAERKRAGQRPTRPGMAKVYFGIGRDANVTQRDLVGALVNEAGLNSADIGTIDLTDRFALIEVPKELADYVIESMQGVRIRGRRVNVRADRPARSGA